MILFSALILAGGQSSRMGQDKALLNVQGVPLLQRVCEVALQCTPEVSVVTAWTERYQACLPSPCQLVREVCHAGMRGPLAGFRQGLAEVKTEWVLLLACDLPYLDASVLQQWGQRLETLPPEIIALLPRQSQGWEPLCGFYRSCCREDLSRFLEAGGRSFQSWLARQTVEAIAPPNSTMLFNCNTPADLAALTQSLS